MLKNLRSVVLNIVFLCLCLGVYTSCMTPKRALKKGTLAYEMGEYYKAVPKLKKARRLPSKTDKAKVNFMLGESYNHLLNFTSAEGAYHLATRYLYADSVVFLRLAQMQQINTKYDDAINYYNKYLQVDPQSEVALNGIEACKAMKLLKEPSTYTVMPFAILNSRKSDYCPSFMGTKYNTIYLTSNRKGADGDKLSNITGAKTTDIFYSKLNAQGKWVAPVVLEGGVNTAADEGVVTFNEQGTLMYFTRSVHEGLDSLRTMIMESQRTGAKWSNPKVLKIAPDSVLVAHPALTPDASRLYFVSDMKGGMGGKDIWYIEKTDGKWGAPVNMGPDINTPGDEVFPYVRTPKELYFSSNGHEGIGGLDIFKAKRNEEGKWIVEHMPAPINSNKDDFGICFEGASEKGYFSSNRGNPRGLDNIFRFEIPFYDLKVSGTIKDSETKEPLNLARVHLVGNDGMNVHPEVRKNGSFHEAALHEGTRYQFLVSLPGYLSQRLTFETYNMKQDHEYAFDVQLVSINKPVTLNNVFYDFGSWELKPEAKTSLDSLAATLEDNPNITIEISSHTDAIGTDSANFELSQKRAQGVVDYLIDKGIDSTRLTAVGYGESQPVVVTEDMLAKYTFLRMGDVLDDKLIAILTKRQQVIANQINRRTEFTVLRTNFKNKKNK